MKMKQTKFDKINRDLHSLKGSIVLSSHGIFTWIEAVEKDAIPE